MENPTPEQRGRITERPDGFYWQDSADGMLYGPFPTLLAAQQDMQFEVEHDLEEGESLEQAEEEIGISTFPDPDTGEPAEGVLPHFNIE